MKNRAISQLVNGQKPKNMKDVVVIGVAGGTGSGKSTLVKRLQEAFKNDDVATICHDFYYKAHPELTRQGISLP